ncbi:unnamed protein product [Rhizophagus irregularis]|uniref:Condensin complex subunit 1 n=1 Tax=Rhizophagus irregularis TaxID=588596 RepID=A0A915ZJ85_9GLOM|nr:unnamed protein product [Rhizophagus irregularis]CAB4488811.1 unnamed protein product [Rhizophagus irregularis]CAB5203369.1 unnamed protein product [Rhizophagus irregularis]CAB5379552.1 unnamed protein product [Rhizophagus irregularis]
MADFFDLSEEIVKLQDTIYPISNELPISNLAATEIERLLNDIVDKISVYSYAIANVELFSVLCSFIKNFDSLKPATLNRVLDIILSGLKSECANTSDSLDADDESTYSKHRVALEIYGFFLYWFIINAEDKAVSKNDANGGSGVRTKRARQPKSKTTSNNHEDWDWSTQREEVLALMTKVLELRIKKIWTSTHEIETFVSLFTKSAYRMLENVTMTKPSSIKSIKSLVYTILSICVKEHNHAFGAQTTIIQNLQYYEHLSEPMAEFLQVLIQQYGHTQLAENTLGEISDKEFNSQDTTGPKSFSKFLIKLSALAPKVVIKQIGLLRKHLDSDSYTMRCGLIEVIGNLINDLAQQEDNAPNNMHQVGGFFDILDERFLDVNSYCRSKVLQVYFKIWDLRVKFPKRRQKVANLAIRCLEDKASLVRKNAIKLLTKLISTHPYGIMHGGELSIKEWEKRLNKAEEDLKAIQPPQELVEFGAEALTENDNEDTNSEVETLGEDIEMMEATATPQLSSSDEIMKLHLIKRFNADAVRFIHQIHTAIPTLCQLLASTTKSEVIEGIEFFETAQLYKIEKAGEGIKKMLHLIWTKDNNDEGKSIRKRLIESYRKLYIDPDTSISEKENVNIVTKNLISLTYNATLAELTSLEQLLSTIMEEEEAVISDNVINRLWSIYSTGEISKEQRRGAIIVLNMLAKAKMEIVQEKIDLLLKVGLGQFGKTDLVLAKYTCIALQRLSGNKTKVKGALSDNSIRLPMSHQIFQRLKQIIEFQTTSQEWFRVTEQAINAIYLLGEHPDILCGDIIKRKATLVFDLKIPDNENYMEIDEESLLTSQEPFLANPLHLSQLIFIVGHVAIKQIVHLEVIEAEWKRRKAEAESKDKEKSAKNPGDDELEQVVGTTEDEYGEAIAQIREQELLFDPNSLLAVFGPLIISICANNKTYNHHNLQIAATLALAKLMCVSSGFCEDNLQLLFTILERSNEPTIRSNIIIALGDMTVCFNNIINENINYIYNRLSDPDNLVKKNTLMVLTHLILNGMIKVKGQLGEMAKCLEDSEQRISDLAKLFFTELASKDNAVYNNLPDIISNLSSGENTVNEESFKKIMKFLFDFIEKEKQTENVVEKLCQRFKNLDDRRQWRDIAYCLSLLPYKTEKSFKKLTEGLAHYQDKLNENDVYKYFTEIIGKAKAVKGQRPEMKQIIEEFEVKIEDHRKRSQEQEETMQKAAEAAQKTKKSSKSTRSSRSSGSSRSTRSTGSTKSTRSSSGSSTSTLDH